SPDESRRRRLLSPMAWCRSRGDRRSCNNPGDAHAKPLSCTHGSVGPKGQLSCRWAGGGQGGRSPAASSNPPLGVSSPSSAPLAPALPPPAHLSSSLPLCFRWTWLWPILRGRTGGG